MFRKIGLILIVALIALVFPVSMIYAATLASPATISNTLTNDTYDGINTMPARNTFYAAGRHWIFYVDEDTDVVYESSTYGYNWSGDDIVTTTALYGVEVACWYDYASETVHYARNQLANGQPAAIKYRMGTPNSNGTITWAAAEQTVSLTPSVLASIRTTITVDEAGYPWVAWIDTDDTNTSGIVYVESSSTKNGTWTEDVAQRFGSGGVVTDGTGTMTGSPVTLAPGSNTPTVTVAGTFIIDLPIGNSGTATTGGWTITGSPVALVEGQNEITVQAGGSGTITIETDLDDHAWFVALTPIGTSGDMVEVEWAAENVSGGEGDGEIGLYASVYDDTPITGGWSTRDTVVAEGSLHELRPDAFSFCDIGSSMYCVYTDVDGHVNFRVRSSIQTWVAADASDQIKESVVEDYYPSLSVYRTDPTPGDDLICFVHGSIALWYNIYDFNTTTWGGWNLIWQVPDTDHDVISRHVSTYSYNSPVGFAWQYTSDSLSQDIVHYWWIDNTNDTLGYYSSNVPLDESVQGIVSLYPLILLTCGILLMFVFFVKEQYTISIILIIVMLIYIIVAGLSGVNAGIAELF